MVAKILSSLLIVLIVILQFNVWYGDNGKQKIDSLQLTISQQLKQNKRLNLQNQELKREIYLIRNKPELLEEKAREQLGLIKKDEVFYRIIPSEIE